MSPRLHPNSSSSGLRKTAREKVTPVPSMMMATDTPRRVQP
jgi:hypothetical protein